MKSFREIINNLTGMDKYCEERDNDRFLMGECLLEMKRKLWKSDEICFTPDNWDKFGFRIFSQSNEDGLIQFLINNIEIPNKTFVEFGVEDYTECNTRFLLMHDDWSGLIMDGSTENMEKLKKTSIYWKHDIEAIGVFITKENINKVIMKRGFHEDIGILSIDIDGNDYWIWDAINCVKPCIVICEYNPIYGPNANVSLPYKQDFNRTVAHYSNLYWGASLGAYVCLGKKKGYKLVCINQMGHNAFFVREDMKCDLPEIPIELAWRDVKYRESRDRKGNLTFLSQRDGLRLIQDEIIVDIMDGKLKKIKECCNL